MLNSYFALNNYYTLYDRYRYIKFVRLTHKVADSLGYAVIFVCVGDVISLCLKLIGCISHGHADVAAFTIAMSFSVSPTAIVSSAAIFRI